MWRSGSTEEWTWFSRKLTWPGWTRRNGPGRQLIDTKAWWVGPTPPNVREGLRDGLALQPVAETPQVARRVFLVKDHNKLVSFPADGLHRRVVQEQRGELPEVGRELGLD